MFGTGQTTVVNLPLSRSQKKIMRNVVKTREIVLFLVQIRIFPNDLLNKA